MVGWHFCNHFSIAPAHLARKMLCTTLSGKLYEQLRNDENGSMPLCLLTQNHYGNTPVESCHTLSDFPVVFVGNAVVNEHVQSIQRFTRYL